MKTLYFSTLLLSAITLAGCFSHREIQVEMVSAELIRIDTVHRYSESHVKQQLTWRDNEDVKYISYASLETNYSLGTRMAVLRAR
jgi:hypothetical protein